MTMQVYLKINGFVGFLKFFLYCEVFRQPFFICSEQFFYRKKINYTSKPRKELVNKNCQLRNAPFQIFS